MPDNNYLLEGVNQATAARAQVSGSWADTWKNYAVQYALQEKQNEQNLQLWNLMNEYNSPKNQMQRYAEAGLNPNLIYQQGTPGNAGSQATAGKPDVKIQPNADRMLQIQQASEVIGMVTNLAGNISNLIDQGLNVQLKRNELKMSDIDVARALKYGQGNYGGMTGEQFLNLSLNPLSQAFDPQAFLYFSKSGQLPQFWNNFLTGVSSRALTGYKSDYQKFTNEHLLPLFEEYQQGKVDIQAIEKELKEYNRTAIEMLPPEIRGILSPLVEYLSPFLKFIFKRNTITH